MHEAQRAARFVYRDQSNTMGTRKRTDFQLIYSGSSEKKADSKYSSTRAISMQMISFSQNYNQPTQHFAFHLTADRIKLNGVPKVSQRLRISCCFMHIGERLNRIKRKK